MFKPDQLDLLRTFINACKAKPDLLHSEDLSFFKEWLLSLGATLPEDTPNSDEKRSEPEGPTCCDHDDDGDDDMPDLEEVKEDQKEEVVSDNNSDEEIESDLELEELDGIIKEEEAGKLEMGDDGIEVTEEMMDESNCKRGEAMSHLGDGDIDAAIASFTEAIKKNPQSANMYAKRASALIRASRPSAALLDCEKAISINKDSAQPYKWRGRAYRLLGKYVEAYHDFQTACRLDFDEMCREWQKEVEPNAKKIMEHNRKYERLDKEREINKRIKEAKRRKAEAEKEYERARKEEQNKPQGGGFPGGFPGGMGGMPGGMGGMPGGMGGMPGGMGGMPGGMGGMPGGMPGGMGGMPGGMPGGGAGGMPGGGGGGMPDLNALFSDPEIMTAMQDPEVMAAFQDVSKNPANMSKYEGNPKVKKVIEKLQSKFGGGKMPGAH